MRDSAEGEALLSLPARFAAVATNLKSGALAVFDQGDLGLAVQAPEQRPETV